MRVQTAPHTTPHFLCSSATNLQSGKWIGPVVLEMCEGQTDRQTETHVVLQQDEHAPLCQLFGRDELVPGLSELLCRDFPPSSPLVVKVQATTVQLLQLVLKNQSEQRSETQTSAEHLDQNICSDSVPDAFWV